MRKEGKAYQLLDSKLRKFLAEQSSKWDENASWRWPSICYTLEHKLAYLEREHYLTGRYSWRGIFHDWEKPFLYLNPFLKESEIQKKHRNNSAHHVESGKLASVPQLVEMYIDWECAALTKPDKPLNAFETLIHFYPKYIEYMLPVCLALNVKSVRSDVFLHLWHKLSTCEAYNEDIYDDVMDVLRQISDDVYTSQWAEIVKEQYVLGKSITQFKPSEIFMLVLMWHSEVMGFEVNYTIVNGISDRIYQEMKHHTHFTHTEHAKMSHHYKDVKHSTYRM